VNQGNPRQRLAEVLATTDEASGSVQLAAKPVSSLQLVVDGHGAVHMPVTDADARRLKALGRPARFGRGEQTLMDRKVRDTWEVPRELVHAQWDAGAIAADLEVVREELGLATGKRLKAELHSLLVYEQGQFFAPHQDSEKDDAMVATLVVTLPSRHTGGELVVHHLDEKTSYRGFDDQISLVAFYADCRHEVRRLTSGHRVALTYNLLLDGDSASLPSEQGLIESAARALREQVTTPTSRSYAGPASPPRRLVVLLDHQYTERGLAASRLKGNDVGRVAVLREAAGLAGFESALALTDVRETRDATPPYGGRSRYIEVAESDDEDGGDLLDSEIVLTWWADAETGPGPIASPVTDDEVCATTPSSVMKAYATERQGYMGNYGNTVDRWYRRAALVLWPRRLGFATRAQLSPLWGVEELERIARAADPDVAARAARTLVPVWKEAVAKVVRQGELLAGALVAAVAVDDPEVAAALLAPFAIETVQPEHADALAEVARRYGAGWTADTLRNWFGHRHGWVSQRMSREAWSGTLPELCTALAGSGAAGATVARSVLTSTWAWLDASAVPALARATTPERRRLAELGPPLTALLEAASTLGTADLIEAILGRLDGHGEAADPWIMAALKAAGSADADRLALVRLAGDLRSRLTARLALPERRPDDWSMTLPPGCDCELCRTLADFLADPAQLTLEWPLRQDRRTHIERRIKDAELPVALMTRRVGSPHTLLLTKTAQLFEREAHRRQQDVADLAWLGERWP
jgi:predicted 2-oxoglutarate/Fe(II)-dependent dioxygenase YbiX